MGPDLYNPKLMRAFADQASPGLYDIIIDSITRDDHRVQKQRKDILEQRTVVLLHTLAYFR